MFNKYMKNSQRGFTLMEVLIVATVVGILVTVGTVQYLEVKRRGKENYCAQRLSQIAAYEKMYYRDFGEYADFDDLRVEGYIDWDYLYKDDTTLHYLRPVYIQEYKLLFEIDGDANTYKVTATPAVDQPQLWYPRWVPLGGIDDLRSMYVETDGVVRWLDSGRPVF